MRQKSLRRRKKAGEEIWLLSYADLITNLMIFFASMMAISEISQVKMQEMAQKMSGKTQSTDLKVIAKELQTEIEKQGYADEIETKLTSRGLEIAMNSGVMFDSGSAKIHKEWQSILQSVLQKITPYASQYSFAVEGHTDSIPIKSTLYSSNWELSSERANSVRENLEAIGIPRNHLRTEGYADTVPIEPIELAGLSPEEINSRHRRVVVRIF